jgi:hypothetical protein
MDNKIVSKDHHLRRQTALNCLPISNLSWTSSLTTLFPLYYLQLKISYSSGTSTINDKRPTSHHHDFFSPLLLSQLVSFVDRFQGGCGSEYRPCYLSIVHVTNAIYYRWILTNNAIYGPLPSEVSMGEEIVVSVDICHGPMVYCELSM